MRPLSNVSFDSDVTERYPLTSQQVAPEVPHQVSLEGMVIPHFALLYFASIASLEAKRKLEVHSDCLIAFRKRK